MIYYSELEHDNSVEFYRSLNIRLQVLVYSDYSTCMAGMCFPSLQMQLVDVQRQDGQYLN